jgi:hypothetical protein
MTREHQQRTNMTITESQTVPYDRHPYPNHLYRYPDGYHREAFDDIVADMELPRISTRLPLSWSIELCGIKYTEKWVRAYSAFRHVCDCFALASLYACEKTKTKMPIVTGRKLDRQLLLANAEILRLSGKIVVAKNNRVAA